MQSENGWSDEGWFLPALTYTKVGRQSFPHTTLMLDFEKCQFARLSHLGRLPVENRAASNQTKSLRK